MWASAVGKVMPACWSQLVRVVIDSGWLSLNLKCSWNCWLKFGLGWYAFNRVCWVEFWVEVVCWLCVGLSQTMTCKQITSFMEISQGHRGSIDFPIKEQPMDVDDTDEEMDLNFQSLGITSGQSTNRYFRFIFLLLI